MLKLRPKAAAAEASLIPREYSGMPQAWKDYVSSLSPDVRADFLAVLDKNGGARGMAAQDSAFRIVRHPAANNLTAAEIEAARGTTTAARPAAPSAASEAVETARSISPVEMAVKQSKYPGRYLNPETGQAQSVFDPLLGQNKPAMGAIHDPFEALAQRVSEMPGPVDYLTKPRPVINPETGNQLQSIGPKGQFGPYRYEFTPGQRVAQGTAIGAPLAAAGYALSPSPEGPYSALSKTDNSFTPREFIGAKNAIERGSNFVAPEVQGPPEMQGPYEMQGPPMPTAVQLAKMRMGAAQATGERAPQPMRRPADEGMFSKIFNSPVSTRELYQRSQDNPEDAGAYMRAERQYAATHKDAPSFDLTKLNEQGMKRGGAANGKPDSVHKALEIIHHLLTRSH
jgi:hypothetical protein